MLRLTRLDESSPPEKFDGYVFLPRALSKRRWMEPHLRMIPIGAQMMLVGSRPA